MMAALAFPNIDPVLLRIGPLQVHWYGIAYLVGFVAAGLIMRSRARRWGLGLSDDDIVELVLAAVIGVIVDRVWATCSSTADPNTGDIRAGPRYLGRGYVVPRWTRRNPHSLRDRSPDVTD